MASFCTAAGSNGASSNGAGKLPSLSIPKPKATQKWALQEGDFAQGLVGGKSSNLALLRKKVEQPFVHLCSIALCTGMKLYMPEACSNCYGIVCNTAKYKDRVRQSAAIACRCLMA